MEEEKELTFSDILRIFKRRKWTFLIIFFLTIFLTGIYLFFIATPKYEAKQVIEYKSSSSQPTVSLGSMSSAANLLGISQPSDSGLTTEIERMKADWVLANVVKELNLVEKANENKGLIARLRGTEITERYLIDSLKEDINIQNVEETNMIEISYQSSDPTIAASVVSLVYSYYTDYAKNLYFEDSQSYLNQVETLFEDVSHQYDQINKEVLDFQTKNKLQGTTLDPSSESTQGVDPLINYYSETYMNILKLEADKNQLEIRKQAIEDNIFKMSPETKEFILTNTEKDTPVKDIKSKLVSDRIELETLKLNSPSSPRIGALEAEISVLENELENNLEAIFSNDLNFLASIDMATFNEYTGIITQLQLFDVTKQVYENMLQLIDDEIAKRSPIMYEYFLLRKDQAILQTRYNTLLTVLEQERMKASLYDNKFTVITSAYIPENPVAPNTTLILVIGVGVAIALGILSVFVREVNDKTVKDLYEFESLFGVPDIILDDSNDAEKIVNYVYKKDFKKFGLLFLGNFSVAQNLSQRIYNILNTIKPYKTEYFTSIENEDYKEKFEKFEKFKNTNEAFIMFDNFNNSDYILYRDDLEKIIIFIEEKTTNLEDIMEILEKEKDPTVVYVKKY
ncbi:lipopolysaccharide biosynthesis protein [Petrotoga mobilis SJ95]|uniref:Lipopolysaccharide biosynthesis protein n=1 Tax=Petrotoga mobilis (strain DSM 10674 / SJ95) TaxID=403833 RepID=A9BJS4_PETMO|nr:Wzz/FepE/Etk N-terminal domain-containing protein [Petrotoga mobilis]ABX31667.1 lipopolysaccharide biosynthesis protein [Petrotoga mobilis SJ95]